MVVKVVKGTNKTDFDKAMKEMREADMDVYNYMSRIPVRHWSRHAFDAHVKSDHVTKNISECFNSCIDRFRGQPALTLLENLRKSFMKRFHIRHEEAKKWRTETPPDAGRFVQVMCASQASYEVKEGNKYYIFKLDLKTCDCKKNMPGRPRKNRKRGLDEQAKSKRSTGAKYGACGVFGHNVRTCKHKGETNASAKSAMCKNKVAHTVLGKRKFEVGSSSNQPQKEKKKKKQTVFAPPPVSQPIPTSQSVPVSQSLQCSQPLSQNAPTDQPTQVINIVVFNFLKYTDIEIIFIYSFSCFVNYLGLMVTVDETILFNSCCPKCGLDIL
ncbi:hypothetical protein ACOSQ2_019816 [Xanthoceras sorbifolium]